MESTKVFKAITVMRSRGFGNPLNFDKFVPYRCVHMASSNEMGFSVLTSRGCQEEVKKEVMDIMTEEFPEVKVSVSVEPWNELFIGMED